MYNKLKQIEMEQKDIKKEIIKTKKIMDTLMDCISNGQNEYYKDYIEASKYYLLLNSSLTN